MADAVLLCDQNWRILRIRKAAPEFTFREADDFCSMTAEKDALCEKTEEEYSMFLTFPDWKLKRMALIHSYAEGKLVVLAQVSDVEAFVAFQNELPGHREWAKDHLVGLYHDEYFQIQQINNKLIDAQRCLVRNNRKLELALEENRETTQKLNEARKAAEKARELAQQADRSKTEFLANMSHEIRTPMNAIIGITELMKHHVKEPEMMQSYIQKLQSSGNYLLGLINDILDLSKIENGSMELRKEPMNLEEEIEQIIALIRPQAVRRSQQLNVQTVIRQNAVTGDAVRLRQMLVNLLSNAVKYTKEGGAVRFLAEELSEKEKNGCVYRFVVEDNGIGMSEDFIRDIFKPFARAEHYVKEIQGTGLGMAITKRIVDAMGGTIQVSSTLGKGSRFEILVPMQPDLGKEATVEQGISGKTDQNASGKKSLKGMKFLCAEDNELNAEILSALLELEGASCMVCENGKVLTEVFEQAGAGDYDAILTDVQMPVMDGYEAVRRIRNGKNPLGRTIPIIAMTANAFSEDIRKSLDAGMNAHISKPVEMKALEKALRNITK